MPCSNAYLFFTRLYQKKKKVPHPLLHMSRKHYYSANQTKDDKERSV